MNEMATPDPYGNDSTGDILLAFSGLLSVVSSVMYVVWVFKARTAPRHCALNTFRFDLKVNVFYTVLFNVFYITYCINDMPQAQAKHRMIHGTAATSNGSAPAQEELPNQP